MSTRNCKVAHLPRDTIIMHFTAVLSVLLALGEKGGELNSKIHSSVKKVVSVLDAHAICRNMNRNLQKCRNASFHHERTARQNVTKFIFF